MHPCTFRKIKKQNKIQHDRGGKDGIATKKIYFQLHWLIKPTSDVNVVPPLLGVPSWRVIFDMYLMIMVPVKLWVKIALQNTFQYRALGDLFRAEGFGIVQDHLFDPGIVRKMIRCPRTGDEIVLAVDQDLKNFMVDLHDVTRVMEQNGRIQNIGKGIEEYNCFDTGIFLCNPALFSALEQSSLDFEDDSLSGGVLVMAREGRVRTLPVDGMFWIDIDDSTNFIQAESYLLANS